METETPQTEISSYLAQLLHERSLNAIQRSWGYQEPKVDQVKAELTELGDILLNIQNLHIYDQHKQISDDCLDDWLWRFKDLFYVTENLLDDLDFIESGSSEWQGYDVSAFEEMHFMEAIEKLPEVIETARGLFIEIQQLETLKPVCTSLDQQINTSSGLRTLPYKVRELKGRAVEKEKILEALLHKAEEESQEPWLIWITGPVGIGKTDLARAVYNSGQVEAEFDVREWIYMGNYRCDNTRFTLQRSESASVHNSREMEITMGIPVGDLISEIKKIEIKGKKVLIVLDNLTVLANLRVSRIFFFNDLFRYGAKIGSRIIVTSQVRYGASLYDSLLNVELDGLEEEEYLELFKECALGDRNRDKYPELENICGGIAKRFGGNPLAAVMIGRHLKWHLDEDRWRIISRSNLGLIDPTGSIIISALRRSYEQLHGYQKQCYLAFVLFPKNYSFEQDQLRCIWTATGFGSYNSFGVLSERSFFVSSATKNDKFVLHPVLHELAERICDGEFFRFEDEIKKEDDIEIPRKARHVYVTADNFVKVCRVLQKNTHLRSLVIGGILSSEEHKTNFMELLEEVLLNLKDLRLLMVSVLPTGKLLDANAICRLRHLRHLELPGESIQELPTWLSRGHPRHLVLPGESIQEKLESIHEELESIQEELESIQAPFSILEELKPIPALESIHDLLRHLELPGESIEEKLESIQEKMESNQTKVKLLYTSSSAQKLPTQINGETMTKINMLFSNSQIMMFRLKNIEF